MYAINWQFSIAAFDDRMVFVWIFGSVLIGIGFYSHVRYHKEYREMFESHLQTILHALDMTESGCQENTHHL